jgi:hypothetical protein
MAKSAMRLVEACQKAFGQSKQTVYDFYKVYENVPVAFCMKEEVTKGKDQRMVVKRFDARGYFYATEQTPIDVWKLFEENFTEITNSVAVESTATLANIYADNSNCGTVRRKTPTTSKRHSLLIDTEKSSEKSTKDVKEKKENEALSKTSNAATAKKSFAKIDETLTRKKVEQIFQWRNCNKLNEEDLEAYEKFKNNKKVAAATTTTATTVYPPIILEKFVKNNVVVGEPPNSQTIKAVYLPVGENNNIMGGKTVIYNTVVRGRPPVMQAQQPVLPMIALQPQNQTHQQQAYNKLEIKLNTVLHDFT